MKFCFFVLVLLPSEETKAFIKESVKAVEGLIEASEKQKQRSPRRWL